jgi:hypothetical protein
MLLTINNMEGVAYSFSAIIMLLVYIMMSIYTIRHIEYGVDEDSSIFRVINHILIY